MVLRAINSMNNYDTIVIGGGAAGLMAAARSALLGLRVVLLEKNPRPGKKLLLTGGTRCNLTNSNLSKSRIVEFFGNNGKFLLSSFSKFGVVKTLDFFHSFGVATKEEAHGCLFPVSDKAADIVAMFQAIICDRGGSMLCGTAVTDLLIENKNVVGVKLGPKNITARKVVVCTGGMSFPATGSTGDGYAWARKAGHTISLLQPALAPVYLQEPWVKDLKGLSLGDCPVTIYQKNLRQKSVTGDILFTETGLTGPLIHNISGFLGTLLPSTIQLKLDLYPDLSLEDFDKKLTRELQQNHLVRNFLETLIAKRLAAIVLKLSCVDPEKSCNSITKHERQSIARQIKTLTLTVGGIADYSKAMITRGGIKLDEVDSKTLRSKLIENLYFAGEVLDLDGPSGGYNLQVCWTTGYVAGSN